MKKKSELEAVIVTTEYRGVFFGYTKDYSGDIIELKAARLCVYWSSDIQGFMGLAHFGPSKDCKIGPPADIEVRKITAVLKPTAEAIKKWEDAKWPK